MISIPSSRSEGRYLRSKPNASNSCCTYPCLTPRANRPPERRSTTAASSATRNGWCIGKSNTFVPIVMVLVRAAMAAATMSGEGR